MAALPPNCEFVVNFAPELSEAIAETKYLEKLGFGVRKACIFTKHDHVAVVHVPA